MSTTLVWTVISGMWIGNFALRFLPIAAFSRMRMPEPVTRWLSFIPVAVMASLVVVEVLRPKGAWLPLAHNPYLFAVVPTALFYRVTRSLVGSSVAGVLFFLAARWLLGAI